MKYQHVLTNNEKQIGNKFQEKKIAQFSQIIDVRETKDILIYLIIYVNTQ